MDRANLVQNSFFKLYNVKFIVAELLFELRKVVKRIYDAKRVLHFITLHYSSYKLSPSHGSKKEMVKGIKRLNIIF